MIMMLVPKLLMISLGNRVSFVNPVRYRNTYVLNIYAGIKGHPSVNSIGST
jgi:hypothetical protein